jgi:hypothetical protein
LKWSKLWHVAGVAFFVIRFSAEPVPVKQCLTSRRVAELPPLPPPDAIYDFEPQRLRELHQKNQQRCRDAMESLS